MAGVRYSRTGRKLAISAEWKPYFTARDIGLDFPQKLAILSRSGHIIMTQRIPTPAEIGALIRSIRKASGLRQDELAGACGVGLRFIVDLEAGKPTAQIGKALQVLAGLGVTMTLTPPPEGKGRRG